MLTPFIGVVAAVLLLPALVLVCVEKRRKKDATPLVGASMANRKAASAKGFQLDPLLQPEWQKNIALIRQKQGGMTVSLKHFARDGDGDAKPGAAAHMTAREQALEMVMRAPSATPDPHALPAYLMKQLGPRVPRRMSLAANAWSNNENEKADNRATAQTKYHTVSGAMVTEDVDGDVDSGGGGGGGGRAGDAMAAATEAAGAPKRTQLRFERWSQPSGLQQPEPAAAQLPAPPALEISSRSVLYDTSIMVRTRPGDDEDDSLQSRSSAPAAAVAATALAASASCSGANTPTSVSSRRLYHQQSQQQYLQQQQQQQRSPQLQERSSRNASGSANWGAAAALSSPQQPLAVKAVAPVPSGPGTPTAIASPSQVAISTSRRLHQQTFGDSGRGSSPATPTSAAGTGFSRHGSDALADAPGGSGGTGTGSAGTAPLTEEVTPLGSEGGASGGGAGPGNGGRGPAALRTAANMRGPSRLGTTLSSPQQPAVATGAVQWPSLAIDAAADEGAAAAAVSAAAAAAVAAAAASGGCVVVTTSPDERPYQPYPSAATAAAILHSSLMTPSLRTALGSAAPPPLGKAPDTGPPSAPVRAAAAGTVSHPPAFSLLGRGAGAAAAGGAAATVTGASPSAAAAAAGRTVDSPQARRASMFSLKSEFNELKEQFSSQSKLLVEQLAGGHEPAPPAPGPRPPRGMPPLPELGGDGGDGAIPLPAAAAPRVMPRRAVTLTSAATSAAAVAGGLRLGAGGSDAAIASAGSPGGMKGGISASGCLESGPAGVGGGRAAAAATDSPLQRQKSDAPVKTLHHGAYDQLQAMWLEHKQSQQQSAPPPSLQPAPSPPSHYSYRASEPNEPVSYQMLKQAAGSGEGSSRRLQPQPPAQPQMQASGPSPVPRPVHLPWSDSGEAAPRTSPSDGDRGSGGGGRPGPSSFTGAGPGMRSPAGAGGAAAASPSRTGRTPQRVPPGGSGLPPRPPAT
ncbi:hypothetical protein HYH02_009556 [Chlamydomonas schloesseri]|uniref:Uncharacterized protein n=1 Tax=Chlamydomonas schloesseri TaxID=2026947 RepID=A0A835TPZ3_9CHLO|nr:hypothetical protein HYH02_009556 [Chlamydomonas schloesseri]|eukprot:KAG2443145.1 hypothetical protein HYH02_009556 [Chlamydomonas schloesseri]